MVQPLRSEVLVDGIVYGEAPRWHAGRLWFSDVHDHAVKTVDEDGELEVAVRTQYPSGLGWLPDGTLLIAALGAAHLKRADPDGARVFHDLSDRGWSLNDMVIGADGQVYVDLYYRRPNAPPPGDILLITPDGEVRTVASDLATPNGLRSHPTGQR
jgi:sugar lactone lactonase YvrE